MGHVFEKNGINDFYREEVLFKKLLKFTPRLMTWLYRKNRKIGLEPK